MNFFSQVRLIVWLLIAVALGGERAAATGTNPPPISVGFLLTASNLTTTTTTTNVYFTNNPVTTFIMVSNATAFVPFSYTYITNDFSEDVAFAFSDTNLTAVTNGNTVIFSQLSPATNQVIQFSFTWWPHTVGPITNTITVGNSYITNTATTNLVINQVYSGYAVLSVSNYIISQAYITNEWVITNDWVTYGVTITNQGPQTATGVLLTNTLPPGIVLLSASKAYTLAGTNLIFTVGALTNGGTTSYQFTIEPTTNGAYALTDALASPNVYDTSGSNQVAVEELYVTNYLSPLTVASISAQGVDYQSGLVEQTIQIANNSASVAPGVRVVVTGLTNALFNASATNSNQPFVVSPGSLAPGATVNLRLQFLPKGKYPWSFPLTNGQLHAYAVPAAVLNYAPAQFLQASTNINLTRIVTLADGNVLLEFLSTLGRSYTVVYSDNAEFLNPMIATPAYIAPANVVQWLDYGPPGTMSAPTNSGQRYYRVYQNP